MAAHSAPLPEGGAESFPAREKVYQLASFPDAAIGGSLSLGERVRVRTPSPTFRFVGRASVVSDLNRYELIQHLDPRIANLGMDVAAAEFLKTDVTSARAIFDRRRVFSVVM